MATRVALTLDQGSTFSATLDLNDENNNPVDTTGMTGRAQFRRHYTSSNAVSFTTSVSNG